MLGHLGLQDEANLVNRATEETTRAGRLTRDVGGTCTTSEVTEAIMNNLYKGMNI